MSNIIVLWEQTEMEVQVGGIIKRSKIGTDL